MLQPSIGRAKTEDTLNVLTFILGLMNILIYQLQRSAEISYRVGAFLFFMGKTVSSSILTVRSGQFAGGQEPRACDMKKMPKMEFS